MKKLGMFILAAIFTLGCSTLPPATPPPEAPETVWQIIERSKRAEFLELRRAWIAYKNLCEDYYDCKGVSFAKVRMFEQSRTRPGLRGFYVGDEKIYIGRHLSDKEVKYTAFHELVHYIDVQSGAMTLPGPAYEVCKSERNAWDATRLYMLDNGEENVTPRGAWVAWYSHCRPYANLLYPDIYPAPLSGWGPMYREHTGEY